MVKERNTKGLSNLETNIQCQCCQQMDDTGTLGSEGSKHDFKKMCLQMTKKLYCFRLS